MFNLPLTKKINMKSLQLIAIALLASIALSSCSSNGAERANDLCDCAMDGNMISMEAMTGISDESTDKLEKCVRGVLKDVKSDVEDMDKEDQVKYLREMMQGVFDTECYEATATLGLSFMSLESIVDLALSEDGLDELFGSSSYDEDYDWDDYDYEDFEYDYDYEDFEYDYDDEYGEESDL